MIIKIFLSGYRCSGPTKLVIIIIDVLQDSGDTGILEVTGYLRGQPLSANDLIHITGCGDFQMSRIEAPGDPYSLEKERKKPKTSPDDNSMEFETVTKILEEADPTKQVRNWHSDRITSSLQQFYIKYGLSWRRLLKAVTPMKFGFK